MMKIQDAPWKLDVIADAEVVVIGGGLPTMAATVALDEQCTLHQLATKKIQTALKKNGVPL